MSVELVHVYRGDLVESIHRGDIVLVNHKGEILDAYGDPYKRTFWRSSAKPFQVIPFIEAGGIDRYKITAAELAIMTSSHGGEKRHVTLIKQLLKKMDKTLDDLKCGRARPMYEGAYRQLLQENIPFSQGNNPCSGKHSGMIGYGLLSGLDLDSYTELKHPIQQKMLKTIAEMTDLQSEDIDIAIDGCGVPVFGLPIYNMALAYAQLAGGDFEHPRKEILAIIAGAMTKEPFYVAGTTRLDTILMEETSGRILAKLGAESVYCVSIIGEGIGFAMKTEDGSYRALDAVVPDFLRKHGYISEEEHKRIYKRLPIQIKNHRDEVVGEMRSVLD
ncbi:MAG: asparaginase [Clostridia bacterium]|nr:asparaginase [Clostridia bacterium]